MTASYATQPRLGQTVPAQVDNGIDVKQRLPTTALTWDVPSAVPDSAISPEEHNTSPTHSTKADLRPTACMHQTMQRTAFNKTSKTHLRAVVQHLLHAESSEAREKWTVAIARLAQEAAISLSPPDMVEYGVSDPRFYIKVKCLPYDSLAGDSYVVQGLVCRKNVAHRRMRSSIQQPRIVMLRGALESNRGSSSCLSSFETVIEKEEDYLRAAVEKLAALRPDVLLVERSVARCAQGLLLDKGIALVLNVKRSLLDRLSRCTGAKVAASLHDLGPKCVACCQDFVVEPLTAPQTTSPPETDAAAADDKASLAVSNAADEQPAVASAASSAPSWKAPLTQQGAKTLMFFRGTPLHMGCTILLKGESREQLSRLKAVTTFAVFVAYRLRLESAFLADQCIAASYAAEGLTPPCLQPAPVSQQGLSDRFRNSFPRLRKEANTASPPTDSPRTILSEPLPEVSNSSALAAGPLGNCCRSEIGTDAVSDHGNGPESTAADHFSTLLQQSAELTAEDVAHHGARLSLSPHFALWPAQPVLPRLNASTPLLQPPDTSSSKAQVSAPNHATKAPNGTSPAHTSSVAGSPQDFSLTPLPSPRKQHQPQPPPAAASSTAAAIAGMEVDDCLVFSTASRNPTKKLLCAGPQMQAIQPYDSLDTTFRSFLLSALPAPDRKCASPACGGGFTHHLRTFLHGSQRVTLSVAQLPASSELPGAQSGDLWLWARPLPMGTAPVAGVRRMRLSPEACCLSTGHFLQLAFGVQHFECHGWHAHNDWVRYVGCGSGVVCIHVEAVVPNIVALPPSTITYSSLLQQEWLRHELQELSKEAQLAFSAVEYALRQHQSDTPQQSQDAILQSHLDGLAAELQVYDDDLMDIATLLRLNCSVPKPGSRDMPQQERNDQELEDASDGATQVSKPVRDPILIAIVWELNRLRRSLMLTVLAWSASLHDPTTYTRSYSATIERNSKSGVSAFIADSAAAEAAPAADPPRSEDSQAPSASKAAHPTQPIDIPAADKPPLAALPTESRSAAVALDDCKPSLPENPPQGHVAEHLSPSRVQDAASGDTSSASAYAATALADTPTNSHMHQADAVGGSHARPVTAADTASIHWRQHLVASQQQVDGTQPLHTLPPSGGVARLRAIFENSGAPDESSTLQRQRTIEWLTAVDCDDVAAHSSGGDMRRRSVDTSMLPSQAVGPWGPVLKRRRASCFGGRAYPDVHDSPQPEPLGFEGRGLEDNAPMQEPVCNEAAAIPPGEHITDCTCGSHHAGSDDESSSSSSGSGSQSGRASTSLSDSLTAHVPRRSSVMLDLVSNPCDKCQTNQESGRVMESGSGSGISRSCSAAQLTRQPSACDSIASSNSFDAAASEGGEVGQRSVVSSNRRHRRTLSEPSTPEAPSALGQSCPRDGSGELPHFEEWASFVRGARKSRAVHSPGNNSSSLTESVVKGRDGPLVNGDSDSRDGLLDSSAPSAPVTPPVPVRSDGPFKRPHLTGLATMKKLSLRRQPNSASSAAGTIPLATSGRVELGGRALLPPGIDDVVLSIFDDEPTSIVAYFLANRTYQQYMEDSLEAILSDGAPRSQASHPAAQDALKRAFSTSSNASTMEAAASAAAAHSTAAAAAAAAAATDAAARSSSTQAAPPPSTSASTPALTMGASNLSPAPTSLRSPEKGTLQSSVPPDPGVARSSASLTAQAMRNSLKASTASADDSNGSVAEAPLPDLPPAAAIASSLYGLRLTDDEPSAACLPDSQTASQSGSQPQKPGPGKAVSTRAAEAADRVVQAVITIATSAADAVQAAGSDASSKGPPSGMPSSKGPPSGMPSSKGLPSGVPAAAAAPAANGLAIDVNSGSSATDREGDDTATASPRDRGSHDKSTTGASNGVIPPAGAEAVGDRVLTCEDKMEFKCTVEESPGMPWPRAKFEVVAYYAPQFAELRRRWVAGGEAAYVASLSRCRKWDSSGGKSNAYFAKTRDERYIVKQLSRSEKGSLLNTAPAYFAYLARRQQHTCLAKILGVYQVTQKNIGVGHGGDNAKGAGRDGIMELLVMENIFYGRKTNRIYDLKGSERSRLTAEEDARSGAVLMDENLRRSNLSMPVLVDPAAYATLEDALWADTAFLSGLGVMDYSLLVGVDSGNGVLVVGIIDFIRQYTWDKQLETWVKSTGFLAGGKEPTVISPKQYCRRFRAAISSYFTVVPGLERPQPPRNPDL